MIVILARILGPSEFGVYSIYAAVSLVAIEIAAFGSGDVLIKNVAVRRHRFSAYFGHSLIVATILLLPSSLALCWIALFYGLPGEAAIVVFFACAAEIAFGRACVLSEQAFISHRQPTRANLVRLASNGLKLVGAGLVFFFAPRIGVVGWVAVQAVCTMIAGVLSIILVARTIGKPRLVFMPRQLLTGATFSGTQVIRQTQLQVDRLLIGLVATPYVVGIYAAASRVVALGTVPMVTLLRMTYPNFFSLGHNGMRAVIGFGLKVLAGLLAISLVTVAVFYFAAPLIPYLLGDEYVEAVPIAQTLSFIAVAFAFQYSGGDLLSGAGYQGLRLLSTAANLIIIAVGILLFARDGSIESVVYSVLAGNFAGAAFAWSLVALVLIREKTSRPQ